eukprot:g4403.t1
MVRKSHGKSKRTSLKDKYKIKRRVNEHHRKQRRLARKNKTSGIGTKKKLRKDPGIPNLFPFKEQLLRSIEAQRERLEARKLAQKEARRAALLERRAAGRAAAASREEEMVQSAAARAAAFEATAGASEQDADGSLAATSSAAAAAASTRKAYYRELRKVMDEADILLEVLDVRDPLGCRARAVERQFLATQQKKRLVLVLNKIDLVPSEAVRRWMNYLRREFPVVAFKASTQQKGGSGKGGNKLGHFKGGADAAAAAGKLETGLCIGGDTLLQLLKNYSRCHKLKRAITVGIIGYPNVGKSSLINSLKRSHAVGVSPTAGFTKSMQEVQLDSKVRLLDSPGVIFDEDHDPGSLLLRNCISADALEDPVEVATAIVKRCRVEQLMEWFAVASFSSPNEFLYNLAHAKGKLKKGGVPDKAAAARIIVRDWNAGKVPFFTLPPHEAPKADAEVLRMYSEEFDLEKAFKENESAVIEGGSARQSGTMLQMQATPMSMDDDVEW